MRALHVVFLTALLLGACADQTGILVEISSTDLAVPADIDGLRIRAYTPDGLMADQTFAIRSSWPHSLLIRPDVGEALGEVRIEVTATLGGNFAVRRQVMTAFLPGQVRPVDVVLTRSCLNVMCGGESDCVAGTCTGMMTTDAGMPDAGMLDAGTTDAGVDAAGIDADVDAASPDAGHDASVDAGSSDTGIDAFSADVGPGEDASTGCAGATCVVLSEVAAHGTTAFDEFVELYNTSPTAVSIGGCSIIYYAASGASTPRASIPTGTMIAGHGYYLLGSMGYAGAVVPDQPMAWTTGLADSAGTVSFECSGAPVDRLGYGSSATVRETTPAPAISSSNMTASHERKALADSTPTTMSSGGRDATAGNAWDTNDNAMDFVIRPVRDPQSSASPIEPP